MSSRRPLPLAVALLAVAVLAPWPPRAARAFGEATRLDVRRLVHAGLEEDPRPTAARRLAWEVRKRTSVETRLEPTTVRLDDPALFETPFLYWSGAGSFPPLDDASIVGLRRFVAYGGFVLVDDAAPDEGGFTASVREALARAFPTERLRPIPRDHVLYRSFYLVRRPTGRVEGPEALEGLERDGRLAVVASRHDLGGAWARDNLGSYLHAVVPGGERQREEAIRLGVNVVMYALCLDYKDDQVHVPFLLRRRGGAP